MYYSEMQYKVEKENRERTLFSRPSAGGAFFVFVQRLPYPRRVVLSITTKESLSLIKILCLLLTFRPFGSILIKGFVPSRILRALPAEKICKEEPP
jgi:hypothetical protein